MSNQAPLPTRVDLSDAPTDLGNLDSLFPADPVPTALQPLTPAPVAAVSPTPSAPEEPFVKGSSSVYKTREAAVEGINQKDALINQLRQQYALTTGIDPITKQPIVANRSPADDNYTPHTYVEELRAAKTDEELFNVQQRLILATLQPMAPAISGVTRAQASRVTEAEIPEFGTFYNSAEYQATLNAVPSIKEAIEMAEGDIRFHSRLPDLYKTAYLVHRGIQLPDLLKRASSSAPTSPTGRATSAPTTTTPVGDPSVINPSVRTSAGRKEIIAEFEAKFGKTPLPW